MHTTPYGIISTKQQDWEVTLHYHKRLISGNVVPSLSLVCFFWKLLWLNLYPLKCSYITLTFCNIKSTFQGTAHLVTCLKMPAPIPEREVVIEDF